MSALCDLADTVFVKLAVMRFATAVVADSLPLSLRFSLARFDSFMPHREWRRVAVRCGRLIRSVRRTSRVRCSLIAWASCC